MSFESISVIVPVYNEIATVDKLLTQLAPLACDAEIVLVDGYSTDGTYERLQTELSSSNLPIKLLRVPKGRGHGLNAGAAAAHSDILLFLHADSALPPHALTQVRTALRHSDWGCFGIRFTPSSALLHICAWWSNLRASLRRLPFGDQGIFIRRTLFNEAGGFPEIALMEDYQLSLTLRSQGLRPRLAEQRIATSSRRFGTTARQQLHTMCQMARLRAAYRKGVDPATLAARYRDVR